MTEKILCVDDDPDILASYQRVFRKQFQIDTEAEAPRALVRVTSQGPYAVVVADMRMPGMDGLQFLAEVRRATPTAVRIMLTGLSDARAAIDAINEGSVFRFLTKPCPPETLARALSEGLVQYRVALAEKELLRDTLSGSIKLLTDVLAIVNPTAFGRASRVQRLVHQLCRQLSADGDSQVEIAAMLSQLGCVTLPEDILRKLARGFALSPKEWGVFAAHPRVGHDLIANIPRLEAIADIVKYQEKRYDGSGIPDDAVAGEQIPLGARILKLALDFDALSAAGASQAEAFQQLARREGWYDPAMVAALVAVLRAETKYEVHRVAIRELTGDMILAEDLTSTSGELVMARGQGLTPSVRMRLRTMMENREIAEPLSVLVPAAAP